MGMIMIVLWMLYILLAVGIYKLTKRYSTNRWIHRSVLAILILIPTYDIIITNILGGYHCLTTPNAYVTKKVEYPLSIYWEDNVYPGFSAEDRKLMIINYLDGAHLKSMALNGDNGKVYVYRLDKPMWEEVKKEFDASKYKNIYEQYARYVMETSERIYTKETMPKMNYTVRFDEIRLDPLSRKFLYADETTIIDTSTKETIAYNRRIMHFFYNIAPDFAQGNNYYVQYSICGDWYEMHLKAFNMLEWRLNGFGDHKIDLNNKLYNKYIKGGK